MSVCVAHRNKSSAAPTRVHSYVQEVRGSKPGAHNLDLGFHPFEVDCCRNCRHCDALLATYMLCNILNGTCMQTHDGFGINKWAFAYIKTWRIGGITSLPYLVVQYCEGTRDVILNCFEIVYRRQSYGKRMGQKAWHPVQSGSFRCYSLLCAFFSRTIVILNITYTVETGYTFGHFSLIKQEVSTDCLLRNPC